MNINIVYGNLSEYFGIPIWNIKEIRGVILKDRENLIKECFVDKNKGSEIRISQKLIRLRNYFDIDTDSFLATFNKVAHDLNFKSKFKYSTRNLYSFLNSISFDPDAKNIEDSNIESLEDLKNALQNIDLKDPFKIQHKKYIETLNKLIDYIEKQNPSLVQHVNSIKSLKILIYEMFFQYKNIFSDRIYTETNIEFERMWLEETKAINEIKILESDIYTIEKLLFDGKHTITAAFFSSSTMRTEIFSEKRSVIIDYFIKGNSLDLKFNNLKDKLYLITAILYEVVRENIESDKNYINNSLIEYIIEYTTRLISVFIDNSSEFHHGNFQRVLSLISFKNNLKIRYNIDNKLYDNEELINQYLKEINFIVENNYHLIDRVTISKAIDEIAKIQNYYNYFNINKNIYSLYKRELKKLINVYTGTFSMIDIVRSDYWIADKKTNDIKITDIQIDSNEVRFGLELGRAFIEDILFYTREFVDENSHSIDNHRSALKFIESDWNKFDHFKSDKLTVLKNQIEPNFVYKLLPT